MTKEEEELLDAAEQALGSGDPLPECPDCGSSMILKSKKWVELRDHEHPEAKYFRCSKVGCGATHGATMDGKPMGFPGDKLTRYARREAMLAFSILWERGWLPNRSTAYRWMGRAMGLPHNDARVAKFTAAQCFTLIGCVDRFLDKSIDNYLANGNSVRFLKKN